MSDSHWKWAMVITEKISEFQQIKEAGGRCETSESHREINFIISSSLPLNMFWKYVN